jgi:hypothetical protein
VSQPFLLYGPMSPTPIEQEQCFRLLTLNPGTGIIRVPESQTSAINLFDEIPADWVSTLILLHAAAGTRGSSMLAPNHSLLGPLVTNVILFLVEKL